MPANPHEVVKEEARPLGPPALHRIASTLTTVEILLTPAKTRAGLSFRTSRSTRVSRGKQEDSSLNRSDASLSLLAPRESANPRHFVAVAAATQLTNQHRQFEGRCLAPRARFEPAIRWLTGDCSAIAASRQIKQLTWLLVETE